MRAPSETGLLEGRVAFVTGGSRGIGAAISRLLAVHGASVAVGYRRSRSLAEGVVSSIRASGGKAVAAPGDVSNPVEALRALERSTNALGPVEVLVHNAWPGWMGGRLEAVPWSTYQWYVDEMIRPVVELTREALPQLRSRRRGRVILLGSTSMYELNREHTPYIAAKGALLALTRGLARDLGPDGVTVNMVSPSLVWTGEGEPPAEFYQAHAARSALGRIPTAEEVAGAVVFLASPLAGAITGAHIPVSCGSPMHVG